MNEKKKKKNVDKSTTKQTYKIGSALSCLHTYKCSTRRKLIRTWAFFFFIHRLDFQWIRLGYLLRLLTSTSRFIFSKSYSSLLFSFLLFCLFTFISLIYWFFVSLSFGTPQILHSSLSNKLLIQVNLQSWCARWW